MNLPFAPALVVILAVAALLVTALCTGRTRLPARVSSSSRRRSRKA
jgi:hypothetical protein